MHRASAISSTFKIVPLSIFCQARLRLAHYKVITEQTRKPLNELPPPDWWSVRAFAEATNSTVDTTQLKFQPPPKLKLNVPRVTKSRSEPITPSKRHSDSTPAYTPSLGAARSLLKLGLS
ncbi:hypothetical protein TRICI_006150 [Trichomonascus ciferrii]|uniref:Uncharacterized protein n=1 Tax=Trichomonascus ciferrii TaxID=44093 RepID=A0A642US25_9ASCO|nr:hypothetical protein TRICI_006150 [Trichomonascus ciferrii]